VKVSYLEFGIGTTRHDVGMDKVDLPVKGAAGCPAFAHVDWRTPNVPGHYCLQVELLWDDDANPANNMGQHNTNVQPLNSPHAAFTFPVRNDRPTRRAVTLQIDSYRIPALEPCSTDRANNKRDQRQVLLDRHRREAWPVPPGWTVVAHPSEVVSKGDKVQCVILNVDQERVWSVLEPALHAGGFHAFLLHGVTGSGKTEIYLRAIEETVRQGKEAIVLVPEISLTPQTIERFRGRCASVAVLHSHLGDAERGGHWRRVAAGKVQVVVGARSAVFAPTRNLGLIVIDEEHESTFKQESTPRYHARDVAVMRARLEGIPVLLGAATPALESWHNAQRGQYTLLTLPSRVQDLPMPRVALIDLRHDLPRGGAVQALSPSLERSMRYALAEGDHLTPGLMARRPWRQWILNALHAPPRVEV